MIRTFLDSSTLIVVVRGQPPLSERAQAVIQDPGRVFLASVFLQLELEPKARYHRNVHEVAIYEDYFGQVVAWAEPSEELVELARQEATDHGLNALDALHVAASILLNADELVTIEVLRKPIHRVTNVKIVTLAS